MPTIAKTLIICLTILLFNGCVPKVEYVDRVEYIKCTTPTVAKPVMDNTHYDNILDNAKKALRNYANLRAYSLELEKANSVCK